MERALIAAQAVEDAKASGRKLAKEVLDEFMHLFAGMAAAYQPLPPGQEHLPAPPGRAPDEPQFQVYAKLTIETATALAKYQSPTFKAVAVTLAPNDPRPIPAGVDSKSIKTIGGKVVNLADKQAVARAYTRLVAGSKL